MQKRPDLVGVRAADLGEQAVRLPPARERGGDAFGAPQRMAKHEQGVGLAETVAGVAVYRERLAGELDRLVGSVQGESQFGEGGERPAFEHPEARLAGQGDGLLGTGQRLVRPAEVPVGGGQADERFRLGIAVLGLTGQVQCLQVVADGLVVPAEVLVDAGQGVQRVGLMPAVAGVAGQCHGGVGEPQGLGMAAGVAVDLGEDAERLGFGPAVSGLEWPQPLSVSMSATRNDKM